MKTHWVAGSMVVSFIEDERSEAGTQRSCPVLRVEKEMTFETATALCALLNAIGAKPT